MIRSGVYTLLIACALRLSRGHATIPRGVYTSLTITAGLFVYYRTHAFIPREVYTPLGIIACPPRLVEGPHDDS